MKQHIKSIDSLRTIAILAVLLIHTTTRTLEASKFNLIEFPLTIFLNQISRFAVPLFFVISGFVLELNAGKKIKYLLYFKKRFGRIAVPFIFWSAIYYLFVYNQNHDNFVRVILTGDASYQLYFIPTLCIFYAVFPLVHRIYKILSNKFVLTLLLVLQVWLLYQDYFVKTFEFIDPIRITILGYFFFIIGMVAARNEEKINWFVHRWKYILLPATGLAGLYVFWEGMSRYLATGNFMTYYSQWRPSILVYTILVGLIFFHISEKPKLQFSIFESFSKLTFFVFFVHVIVLETTWSLFGKNLFSLVSGTVPGKILFDPIFFGVVTGASFLIAHIVRKVPKLHTLTG